MSFQQSHRKERDARLKWNRFCAQNQDLIEGIGLSTPTIETWERFEDLLMHGHIDHHDDWSQFNVSSLDKEQYELFKILVGKYFEAGYFDPGLMAVNHEERIEFARKYPAQFSPDFAEIVRKHDQR